MVFFMNKGERLINSFYKCCQAKDWKGMAQVYHPDIIFYDPVFGSLQGQEVPRMWEMLLSGDTVLDLQFGEIAADEGYGSCRWTATYVFPTTGRKVVNRAKAMFKFEDGKIVEHQDDFSFWKWSAQALGWKGAVFGWTSMLQNGVRTRARRRLDRFMKK
jgi:hypothetical protein